MSPSDVYTIRLKLLDKVATAERWFDYAARQTTSSYQIVTHI